MFDDIVGLPRPIRSAVARLFGLDEAERLYTSLRPTAEDRSAKDQFAKDRPICERLLIGWR